MMTQRELMDLNDSFDLREEVTMVSQIMVVAIVLTAILLYLTHGLAV